MFHIFSNFGEHMKCSLSIFFCIFLVNGVIASNPQNSLSELPPFKSEQIIQSKGHIPSPEYQRQQAKQHSIVLSREYEAREYPGLSRAKPIEEKSGIQSILRKEKIVNRQDGRQLILDTTQFPHSAHGLVLMQFPGGQDPYFGTATMIASRIAITAGHNLVDEDGKLPDNIQFLPARNGKILPFGETKVVAYYVSQEYRETLENEDYGILILDRDSIEQTGSFSLSAPSPQDLLGMVVNITGYPGDKVTKDNYSMYTMSKKHERLDKGNIYYKIDTWGGQSGSGIWTKKGSDHMVVGVHVRGGVHENEGIQLTQDRYEQIHRWIHEVRKKKNLELPLDNDVLNLSNLHIKDMAHLNRNYFPNLLELNLSNNKMKNLRGIENLTRLEKLDVSKNKLKKVEDLTNLIQLRVLILSDNEFTDIQQIKGLDKLTRLKRLNLANNYINKIHGLDNLKKIKKLDLSDNSIKKIKNLSNLLSLEYIDFSENIIQKTTGLSHLDRLKVLNLAGNRDIENTEGLQDLSSLETLILSDTKITKLIIDENDFLKLQELHLPPQSLALKKNKKTFRKLRDRGIVIS